MGQILMRSVLLLSFLLISATSLLGQSRYTVEGDTLTLNMTVEEPGYDFDGGLDAYDETLAFGPPGWYLLVHTFQTTGV